MAGSPGVAFAPTYQTATTQANTAAETHVSVRDTLAGDRRPYLTSNGSGTRYGFIAGTADKRRSSRPLASNAPHPSRCGTFACEPGWSRGPWTSRADRTAKGRTPHSYRVNRHRLHVGFTLSRTASPVRTDLGCMLRGMWRAALPTDDEAMVAMCGALYTEDPGLYPVTAEHMRRTLLALRAAPARGRAVVLELDGQIGGYALLVSFWSNELGGAVCTIDELYVRPQHRGTGHATRLLQGLAARSEPWLQGFVALGLETTPDNVRARRLYQRIGFRGGNIGLKLRFADPR